MKFKRDLIIITLIISMLFTISSVYAADSEIQSGSAYNSTDDFMEGLDDNSLEMNGADEMLAETDNFLALNETINGNSSETYIGLEKDYHGSFDGGNGIQISRPNVVVDGKGHTIDCTGENSRMFNVQMDGITFKNIVFTGGYFSSGGAIYTNKDLTIINCTFKDNQATYIGSEYGGGAIFGYDVKMSIYDSTFIRNYAVSNGGAIAGMGFAPDDWEIFNCTFIDNAAGKGGAFYSNANIHMGSIINSTFIGNRASSADVIYTFGESGTIDRCIFVNNTANSMISALHATELIINNSIIVNNDGRALLDVQYLPNMDNNWWGTTTDDSDDPFVSGNQVENYYVLDMSVDDDSADITLNNLHHNGVVTTSYAGYALPSINLSIKAKRVEVADTVVLGTSGKAIVEHAPSGAYVITIEFNGVELTRELKPSFKWLRDETDSCSEILLEQDCIYDSTRDYTLVDGIKFAKDMTIDGQGHIIDARGLSNIIYFDDNTNLYSLTLKNIVFANAAGRYGAAVYFKGNKIEIINCTFINNKADFYGDAVYVANAVSNANRINESLFIENVGSNSVVCINLDSNANLKVDNSVFMKNGAAKDINATGNVIAEYNWWGNTDENKGEISKTDGVTVNNWLFLRIDAVPAMNGDATISLNNVYDGSEVSAYGGYALQLLTFTLGGSNCTVPVHAITLGDNGQANYQFRMDRPTAALAASYDNVTTSKELEYIVVDDGSFRALNEVIFYSNEDDVIELTHDYAYFDNDTIKEGIVIPRRITINGNGHIIDAKGKTRIFQVPERVSNVTVSNINFINAKAEFGSVIVICAGSDYFIFSNCNFTGNVATSYGGVMDCVGDYCTVENCNFINNHANDKGSVIRYYHKNRADIINCNFISNSVSDCIKDGGVILVDEGVVHIDKSLFINNVANDHCGSVLFTLKSATITNSVFLNNSGNYTIYGSKVKLTNNWFGNNATDYATLSSTVNAMSETWLFLNATVEANSIPESWPTDLSFGLYIYNSTSGDVSGYGNTSFGNLNLIITATNGRIDKNITNMGETISYTPASPGKGGVTATVKNVYCTAEFDVRNREDSNISVENVTADLYVENEFKILYNLYPADAIGNVTFESSNSGVAYVSTEGVVVARGEGSAIIVITFLGSKKYAPSNATVTVNVGKIKIPANDSTVPLGKATDTKVPIYTINLPKDATGTLTITIGTKKYTGKLADGKATVKVEGLSAGRYDVTIVYSGDAKYSAIVKKTTATVITDPKVVAKQSSALYASTYSVTVYGKDAKVAKNTNVVFYINGKKVKTVKTNKKGIATFNIPSTYLPNKIYTIKATSLGKSASKKVTIKQILTLKSVKVKKSAKKLVLTATLNKVNGKYLKGKWITFKFNGKKYTAKTNYKGVAKYTLSSNALKKLKVGKRVTYQATYIKDTVKKTVKVKK